MRDGFTLLEVVVALLLLELAVVAAVGTLVVASHSLAEAEHLERAILEAEGVLDSLAGAQDVVDGARAYAGGTVEWSVDIGGGLVVWVTSADSVQRLEVSGAQAIP
jgi:type II secretory pathway pseudopilin PulG